ncbi:MAG: peptidase domain-containing ABC transporter [Oscillospiraceae bacterium]
MEKENILKILKPLIPQYVVAISLGLFINLLIIGSSFLSKILIDNILPSNNVSMLIEFMIGYLSYFILKSMASFGRNYLFSKHGYRILFDIRGEVYSAIVSKFNFVAFSTENQGYIITLFRDWLNSISWFLSNVLLNTITDCLLLILTLALLAIIDLNMLCITLVTLPIYGFLYLFFNPKIKDTRKSMMEKDAIVTQNLKDSLDSIKEIRVLNAESVFTEKYNASQKEFCNLGLKYVITTAAYSSLTSIASVLGHVIVLLCGTLAVYDGKMSVGTLISLNSIVALLYSPVERIVGFNRVLQAFKIEMAKLNDVLRKNISLDNPQKSVDYCIQSNSPKVETILGLSNVSFSYGERHILEGVCLNFEPGKTYAIVGENGSGKSTLINLITGLLVPSRGNVFFDGINIHNNLEQFRSHIGYVPQDTMLLNESIESNITFCRNAVSEHALEEVLHICEVDVIMKTNSMSIDTVIGEKGNKLSGGQKQKIALSRALYRKPKLLIIDEGTSNIDSDTEERILKRVKSVYPDMTIIIVSHRLSTVRKADRIIVLDKSQVAENGEYAQLLDNGTVFRKIFANQI